MVWSYQQLHSFITVARTANMTSAADQLGFSTGAVSQQMASLEAALGESLFIRLPRGLKLTDAGELFLHEAKNIVQAYARAQAVLEDPGTGHPVTLKLGVFTSAAVAYLPGVLERLRVTHPHIAVQSFEVAIANAPAALASGQIDASLTVSYPNIPMPKNDDVFVRELLREPFFILSGSTGQGGSTTPTQTNPTQTNPTQINPTFTNSKTANNEAADQVPLTKAEIAAGSWIMPPPESFFGRSIRLALHEANISPNVTHSLENHVAAMSLARAGLGFTTVTSSTMNLAANPGRLTPFPVKAARVIEFQTLKSSRARPSIAALEAATEEVISAAD